MPDQLSYFKGPSWLRRVAPRASPLVIDVLAAEQLIGIQVRALVRRFS